MEPNDALEFLTRIGVCGGLELLHQNPHAFLDDLVLAYQEHVPFQVWKPTISHCAIMAP